MSESLLIVLNGGAGELALLQPHHEEKFIEKGWRTNLVFNGDWDRRARDVEFLKARDTLHC